MRESTIMKIHYGTALGAVVLVAVHVLFRVTMMNYEDSLAYENVLANYKFLPYAIMLELILVLISVHGFNGLRVILLEAKTGTNIRKSSNVRMYCCNGRTNSIWFKDYIDHEHGDYINEQNSNSRRTIID